MTKDFIQLTQLVDSVDEKGTVTEETKEFEVHIRTKDIKLFWRAADYVTVIEFYDNKFIKVKENINVLAYSLGSSLI